MSLSPPRFWSQPDHPAGAVLSPLGAAYGAVVRGRMERATPWCAPVPVLCAGNVALGGVGKTPWTMMLARRLTARGRAPHVLTRGYGGTARGPLRVDGQAASEVGDEALLLARAAPTWVGADRAASAEAAVAAGADVLLMDDGFQNPGLAKDVSFLLLSAGGWGNGRVFPAGPLRERPGDAVRRAHAVVCVGAQDQAVPDAIRRLTNGLPLLRAWLDLDASALTDDAPVHALAGIARPERFFDALTRAGHPPARTHAFPDHHAFTDAELDVVLAEAGGAQLVTTEKDHVRLPPAYRDRITALPAMMRTDEAALDAVLAAAT